MGKEDRIGITFHLVDPYEKNYFDRDYLNLKITPEMSSDEIASKLKSRVHYIARNFLVNLDDMAGCLLEIEKESQAREFISNCDNPAEYLFLPLDEDCLKFHEQLLNHAKDKILALVDKFYGKKG